MPGAETKPFLLLFPAAFLERELEFSSARRYPSSVNSFAEHPLLEITQDVFFHPNARIRVFGIFLIDHSWTVCSCVSVFDKPEP